MTHTSECNPFESLGLKPGATAQEIRAAYHQLAKRCHPDQFQGPEEQKAAQEQMIKLNLAYEEALRFAARPPMFVQPVSPEDAKRAARRMLEQGNPESGLRQLARAEHKDAEWFEIQGLCLMKLKQYDTAHQSFREAVRRDPENRLFREEALQAGVEMKKRHPLQMLHGMMKRK